MLEYLRQLYPLADLPLKELNPKLVTLIELLSVNGGQSMRLLDTKT